MPLCHISSVSVCMEMKCSTVRANTLTQTFAHASDPLLMSSLLENDVDLG